VLWLAVVPLLLASMVNYRAGHGRVQLGA
jgi:hypothetical protein